MLIYIAHAQRLEGAQSVPGRRRDRGQGCGERLRVIADIADPRLIQRILEHLRAQPPWRAGPLAPKERHPTTTFYRR